MDLTLPRLAGGELTLSQLRGAPVLLCLFATWDLRSTAEAPVLMQIRDRWGPRGLTVVGVALAPLGSQGLPMVRAYVEEMGLNFPVLLSEADGPQLIRVLGPVRRVPRTLLLDARGRVLHDDEGKTDFTSIIKKLEGLLSH